MIFIDENTIDNYIPENFCSSDSEKMKKLIYSLQNDNNLPEREDFLFTSIKSDFITKMKFFVINFIDMKEIIKRRFLYNMQAMEIMLKNGKSYYFNFYRDFPASEFFIFLKVK